MILSPIFHLIWYLQTIATPQKYIPTKSSKLPKPQKFIPSKVTTLTVCLLYVWMTNFSSQNFVPYGSQLYIMQLCATAIHMHYNSMYQLASYIIASQNMDQTVIICMHLTIVTKLLSNTVVSCRYMCACKLYTSTEVTIINALKFTSITIFIKHSNRTISSHNSCDLQGSYLCMWYPCLNLSNCEVQKHHDHSGFISCC